MRVRPTKFPRPKVRSGADIFCLQGAGEKVKTMSIYTVHEPPLKGEESAPNPERFVFVRDGFSFWAFLLTPLWMLRHRLWLVLTGYIIVATALQVGLVLIGASSTVRITVGLLLSLLVGFEAATLRRFTLSRRRWRNVGIVVGDDLESAERRFFDAWVHNPDADASGRSGDRRPSSLRPTSAMSRRPPASSEVLGLFPEPGAPR
jgi:hypothetical protein